MQTLEDLARAQVRRSPAAGAERLVEGVADERMREPKSPDGWRLGEHTRCYRLVERLENRCLVELCHGGEFLETELATQSRSNLKQAPAPRR